MIRPVSQHLQTICTSLLVAWWEELGAIWHEMRRFLPLRRKQYVELSVRKGAPVHSPPINNARISLTTSRWILGLFKDGSQRAPVRLCLEPNLFLKRRLKLPKTALKDVRRILLLELELSTPFLPTDVFHGWTCSNTDGGEIQVDHVIVKRNLLQPWLDYLFAQHIPFASQVALRADEPLLVELLGDVLRQHPQFRRLRRIRLLAFSMMVAGTISCLVVAHWRESAALDRLVSDVELMKQQATQVRAKLSDLDKISHRTAALHSYRASFPSTLMLWQELTNLLPDSAWLTELKIEKAEIIISGFAQSSAVLLEAIEKAPAFEKVAFASSVMKAPGESSERFTIRAALAAPFPSTRSPP